MANWILKIKRNFEIGKTEKSRKGSVHLEFWTTSLTFFFALVNLIFTSISVFRGMKKLDEKCMSIFHPSRRLDDQHNKDYKFVPFSHQVTNLSPLNSELAEISIASHSRWKGSLLKPFPFSLFLWYWSPVSRLEDWHWKTRQVRESSPHNAPWMTIHQTVLLP